MLLFFLLMSTDNRCLNLLHLLLEVPALYLLLNSHPFISHLQFLFLIADQSQLLFTLSLLPLQLIVSPLQKSVFTPQVEHGFVELFSILQGIANVILQLNVFLLKVVDKRLVLAAFLFGVLIIFALDLEGSFYLDVVFLVFVYLLLTSCIFDADFFVILRGLSYLQLEFINFLSVVVLIDLFDLKLQAIQ